MKRLAQQLVKAKGCYVSNHCQVNNDNNLNFYDYGQKLYRDYKNTLEYDETVVMAEYIWHGGGKELRGKMKTLYIEPGRDAVLDDCGSWSFDGSSTGQATGDSSDVKIVPVKVVKDPFRGGRHIIVLCECMGEDGKPHSTNTRHHAVDVFDRLKDDEWVMAFEQEYFLYHNGKPLGWPADGTFPYYEQGPYYCACGNENCLGRDFTEAHFLCCLYAGLKVEGINAEVALGQWEYQVGGPDVDFDGNIVGGTDGIEVSDQLEISRYFLQRLGEKYGVSVEIHPKPITEGAWNGSGNHCNASTRPMREAGGIADIEDAIEKLRENHWTHVYEYGRDNHYRLSGLFETQFIGTFSYAPADRGSSIRVQRAVYERGLGWFEDRRPSSNCDPYLVCSRIAKTVAGLTDEDFGLTSPDLTNFKAKCQKIADGEVLPIDIDPWV